MRERILDTTKGSDHDNNDDDNTDDMLMMMLMMKLMTILPRLVMWVLSVAKFLTLGMNDNNEMILRLQIVRFWVSIRDRSTTNSVVVLSCLIFLT